MNNIVANGNFAENNSSLGVKIPSSYIPSKDGIGSKIIEGLTNLSKTSPFINNIENENIRPTIGTYGVPKNSSSLENVCSPEEEDVLRKNYLEKMNVLMKSNPRLNIIIKGDEPLDILRRTFHIWTKRIKDLENTTLKGGSILLQENINEATFRANYEVKSAILRKAYPDMNIPFFRDDQTPDEIHSIYKQYVKRIYTETSVENNKIYLFILWVIIEAICCKWLGLPMAGYTVYQNKYMKRYSLLLIELGEKSQIGQAAESWPVEFRIISLAIVNAVLFLIVQYISTRFDMSGSSRDKLQKMVENLMSGEVLANANETLKTANEATADNPEVLDQVKATGGSSTGDALGNLLKGLMGGNGNGNGGGGMLDMLGGLGNITNLLSFFTGNNDDDDNNGGSSSNNTNNKNNKKVNPSGPSVKFKPKVRPIGSKLASSNKNQE